MSADLTAAEAADWADTSDREPIPTETVVLDDDEYWCDHCGRWLKKGQRALETPDSIYCSPECASGEAVAVS